jgi:hypothetical protein
MLSRKSLWDAGFANLISMSLRIRFLLPPTCRGPHNLWLIDEEEEQWQKVCKMMLEASSCCSLKPMRSPGIIKVPFFLLPLHRSNPALLSCTVTPAPFSCTSSLNRSAIKIPQNSPPPQSRPKILSNRVVVKTKLEPLSPNTTLRLFKVQKLIRMSLGYPEDRLP